MKLVLNALLMSGLFLIVTIFTGCVSTQKSDLFDSTPPVPRVGPGSITSQPLATDTQTNQNIARFRVGETVIVTLSTGSLDDANSMPHEESIKEDGTITLDLIGKIQAAGKTAGELQNDIYTNYVPKYYRRLTVSVKSSTDRVYYVGGQVNHPSVQTYLGDTTVSKAVKAAGDFNEFASHTVTLTRAGTSERIKVNLDRVLQGKEVDPPVYPGDQIDVGRSIW